MVSHRELLTFSNLTNLEWEFVELYDKATGRKKDNTFLRDLLDPKMFQRVKEDENGNEIREDVYGEGEEGKIKLRRNAGIAMEYFETDNKEGDFLKDWEVVFGADFLVS